MLFLVMSIINCFFLEREFVFNPGSAGLPTDGFPGTSLLILEYKIMFGVLNFII